MQPPYIPWLTALKCLNSNTPLVHKHSLQYEETASESYPYILRCFWPQPRNLVPDRHHITYQNFVMSIVKIKCMTSINITIKENNAPKIQKLMNSSTLKVETNLERFLIMYKADY